MAKDTSSPFLKRNLGFTLIELITVIAVISIISVIGIATLDPFAQYQKSMDARKKSDLSQIQKVLEQYYEDNNRYPEQAGASDYRVRNNNPEKTTIDWGDSWQPYINVMPSAPDYPSTTYVYAVDDGGQAYYLYASLGRGGKDPQACNNGEKCINAPDDANCGGVCNYGVTSTNVSP